MQNIKKTLEMTGLLFGMAMLFSFIAWFLGYEGFIIFGHFEGLGWTGYVLPPILLCINLSLLTGFVLNLYSWKVLWFSIPMALLSGILGPLNIVPTEMFTGPIPTLILLIAIFCSKKGRWGVIRLVISTVATFIFQALISIMTKIPLSASIKMYDVLRLSISSIILMLLFYSIGGVNYVLGSFIHNDERKHWRRCKKRLEFLVFPGRLRDNYQSGKNGPPSEVDGIPISKFEVMMIWSLIAIVQILQWIFILWVCNLNNYFIDALVITTSFICHGMIIQKRAHNSVILCTLAATIMFYISARFTISFQYSHFFPIVIGLILVYAVYRISYQFEMAVKSKSKQDLERIQKLENKIEEAWDKIDEMYD